MADTQTRIQQNAVLGASLTESVLLQSFWVLKRSVDIDGADFLVQDREEEAVRVQKRPFTLGLVQAKFFEGNNQVRIARSYVEDKDGLRPDFFAFLHTLNDLGKLSSYFFTSAEIARDWSTTKDKTDYFFSLTQDRLFSGYLNRSTSEISESIADGLSRTRTHQTQFLLQKFFDVYVDTRSVSPQSHSITYMLRIVEKCKIVIYRNQTSGSVRPLEPRRDLFPYAGDFSWGYAGTGPQFLSASILGHHLGGARSPSSEEIRRLVATIAKVPEDKGLDFSSDEIDVLLGISQ